MFQCEWITFWCCAAGMHASLQTARGQHQLQHHLRYIFPRPLCCHGECMPFCVVAMGTLYYSLPPALSVFLHDHLYASCTLMLKKNISSTRECPHAGIAFCRNMLRYFWRFRNVSAWQKYPNSWMTFSLWHCMFDSENVRCMRTSQNNAIFFFLTCEPIALKGKNARCLPLIW